MPSPHEIAVAARLRLARGERVAGEALGWPVSRVVRVTKSAVENHRPRVPLAAALHVYFDMDATLADVARITGHPPEVIAAELERRGFMDFMTAKNFSRQSVAKLGVTESIKRGRVRRRVRKAEWANGLRPWTARPIPATGPVLPAGFWSAGLTATRRGFTCSRLTTVASPGSVAVN